MGLGATNPKRQMMINMMYLVLTALLALNVSAEVLKAFALVNKGMEQTNDDFITKNKLIYDQFKKQMELDAKKAGPFNEKAQEVRGEANKMYEMLDKIKQDLAELGGKWKDMDGNLLENVNGKQNPKSFTVDKESDVEIGNDYFINKKNADKLRKALGDFAKLIKTKTNGNIDPDFHLGEPPKKEGVQKTWDEYYFEGIPLIAAITEISKFQNDIRAAEGDAIKFLIKDIDTKTMKFDEVVPIVNAAKSYILQGDQYEADIFLGSYSNTQSPEITIGGQSIKVEEGKGNYKVTANGVGEKKLKGNIRIKDPSGAAKDYPFDIDYTVFQSTAIISADKMNVLYQGLDNPVSVSVPGFTPEQVTASVSGGVATWKSLGKGNYSCIPSDRTRDLDINCIVKNGTKTSTMGSKHFRVRQVPNPVVYVGAKDGGNLMRGEIPLLNAVTAQLPNFAFEGLNYTVLGFTFAVAPKSPANGTFYSEAISGNRLTPNAKNRLTSVKSGDIVIVTEVKTKCPDGKVKTLNGPNLFVK